MRALFHFNLSYLPLSSALTDALFLLPSPSSPPSPSLPSSITLISSRGTLSSLAWRYFPLSFFLSCMHLYCTAWVFFVLNLTPSFHLILCLPRIVCFSGNTTVNCLSFFNITSNAERNMQLCFFFFFFHLPSLTWLYLIEQLHEYFFRRKAIFSYTAVTELKPFFWEGRIYPEFVYTVFNSCYRCPSSMMGSPNLENSSGPTYRLKFVILDII